MKMNGEAFTGPHEAIVVIPRQGKDLVFKARAVLNFEKFDTLCPRPKPKTVRTPKGETKALLDEKGFTEAFDNWGTLKTSYIIIESLRATPGLEWETVDFDNPQTWNNYKQELEKAFFSDREIVRIVGAVWEANAIDESKLEEARARFLAGQEEESKSS